MTLKADIQLRENELAEAASGRDIARIVAMYTEDAQMLPNGAPTFTGRAAIGNFFQAFPPAVVKIKLTTVDVQGDEQHAVEVGSYEMMAQGPAGQLVTADAGRYLITWKRVNGEWLIHRDMFNHATPTI